MTNLRIRDDELAFKDNKNPQEGEFKVLGTFEKNVILEVNGSQVKFSPDQVKGNKRYEAHRGKSGQINPGATDRIPLGR